MKNTTLLKAVAVTLLFALLSVLVACDSNKLMGDNFLDSIPDIPSETESSDDGDDVSDPEPAEGQAHMPVISTTNNVTAGKILVTGTCDLGATVKISGGKEDVTVQSQDGYFMAEVEMTTHTVSIFEAVAFSDTLTESEVRSFEVIYDATAEPRVDGNSVTVGSNSYLIFDSVMEDILGKNLLSQTALKEFKDNVNSRAGLLKKHAGSYPASLIYVLIPDAPTIYTERLPEGIQKESYKTRYDYISETLADSNAVLIDMRDIFEQEKDAHLLYQKTDSHLTEYGSYLVYKEICKEMEKRFPAAKARDLETEFTSQTTTLQGGNLAYYAGLDREIITETVTRYTPNFSLRIGKWEDNEYNIGDYKKYVDETDSRVVSGENDPATQIAVFKTGRSELPSALIYRDDNSILMFDILAERFNNVKFNKVGNYTINMTDAQRYNSTGRTAVDYIIVMVTENNIGSIIAK